MKKHFLWFAFLVFVISCSDGPSSAPSPVAISPAGMTPTEELAGYEFVGKGYITEDALKKTHRLARAIALSLADPQFRAGVRDAMRASPHAEHKLVIQNIASNRTFGPLLLNTLEVRAGLTPDELAETLAVVPQLDFYLPWIEHRLNWRATADVMVGVSLNVNDPKFDAYDLHGNRFTLDAREPLQEAIVFLHPAERKFQRRDDTSGAGDVVQDSEPRGLATSGRGLIPAACDPSDITCAGGGGGGGTPLVLEYFEYFYEGDAVGEGEIEFNIYYVENGNRTRESFLYYGGDDCPYAHDNCNPNTTIWSESTDLDGNHYVSIDVHEEDWPDDEHWGEDFHGNAPTITSESQLGVDLVFERACAPDFNDNPDHDFVFDDIFGGHSGNSACHHGILGGTTTQYIVYRIDFQ